jgi:hypothetical protein
MATARPDALRLALLLGLLSPWLAACPAKHPACAAGQTQCGIVCADTSTNAAHCGSCGHACLPGETCHASSCTCDPAKTLCTTGCFDLTSDPAHCGADCAAAVACPTGASCGAGVCHCPSTAPDLCGSACVDLATDPANCLTCGNLCKPGESCGATGCTCLSPKTSCSTGCFNLDSDVHHCGSCTATACATGASCVTGGCVCPGTVPADCGGACKDLATDESNCGTCGLACATGATCAASTCACPQGEVPCGTSPGTCTDRSTDPANCATCGHACGTGQVCTSSKCCTAGQSVCGTGAGATCCSTPGCCGAGCQTTHANGLGQPFYDCNPVGTHTQASATEAAAAWGSGTAYPTFQCSGNCYCLQKASASATWCYDGNFAGQVSRNDINLTCLCPPGGSFVGTWN